MGALRQPVAPVRSDEALGEVAREVLVALRRRRLQAGSGAGASLTRGQLMARVSAAVGRRVSDRTVRAALEELRAAAHPVVSSSAASGYWLSDDQAEIQECIDRTYLSRIRHHAAAARGLRRAASVVASAPEQQGRLLG